MENIQSQNLSLSNAEELILSQMEELQKDLEAIRRIRSKYDIALPTGNGQEKNAVAIGTVVNESMENGHSEGEHEEPNPKRIIPATYDLAVIWDDKVLFIVKTLGGAYADEVAAEIMRLQPEISETRANHVATNKLSKLYRDGIIKADTTGKKYKYYL